MKSNRLYVGNLNNSTDDKQLKKLFSEYGRVLSIDKKVARDFGYVPKCEFSNKFLKEIITSKGSVINFM